MDLLTDITENYTVQNFDNSAFLIDASAEDVEDIGYVLVLQVNKQIQNLTNIMKKEGYFERSSYLLAIVNDFLVLDFWEEFRRKNPKIRRPNLY